MNIASSMKQQQLNNNNDIKNQKQKKQQQKLKQQQRKQKVLHQALLIIPYFIGILWTTLHPILSVITGELKCRGQYIDENGLDVHRHRVESYPLQRTIVADAPRQVTTTSSTSSSSFVVRGGMCQSIKLRSNSISPSMECLHHVASSTISFDIVRILPPIGPMIESSEAIVIVVGGDHNNNNNKECKDNAAADEDDDDDWWYTNSDMNASIMHMITKLGNKLDCPWLTKTVFIVSPTSSTTSCAVRDIEEDDDQSLASIVDAFITSYMGGQNKNDNAAGRTIQPLPPDFTFPIIRSVLVINDVQDDPDINNNSNGKDNEKERTVVRILPQGTSGTLPNLDLVFATFLSFQSQPASSNNKNRLDSSQSIYYSDASTFSTHPFKNTLFIEQLGHAINSICKMIGLKHKPRLVEQYVKDLVGLFGFVASFVIGPRQPHSSALNQGIDALTIQVHIPSSEGRRRATQLSSSIHPHYADLTRCLEHLLRSVSNLHERLHHSIAQYTMPSPSKFVSHGEYIYPAILVSLPLVVRAALLALKDLKRFEFVYVGMVLGTVCMTTFVIALWNYQIVSADTRSSVQHSTSGWNITRLLYLISYLLVAYVARLKDNNKYMNPTTAAESANKEQSNNLCERRGSLRFIACLIGIYLHAPMLLASYSLGFPSSLFWSPLLAMLILPLSLHQFVTRSKVLTFISFLVKCLFLLITSPPVYLVPQILHHYTPYALGVFTPLHFLLSAIWLAG